MTCSRASHNSRLRRRTSFACRSSVVDPYNDEPPDSNEAALPCTDDDDGHSKKTKKKTATGKKMKKKFNFNRIYIVSINCRGVTKQDHKQHERAKQN